jgi:hypothetical protein
MHNLPYVGISANDMIQKLNLNFIMTTQGLKKMHAQTNTMHATTAYEQKLFNQSEWEKTAHGNH